VIAFDLECSQEHVFECWFDSIQSFEEQQERGIVSCPYCNDSNIRRVISPVAVRKSNPERHTPPGPIDYQRLAKEVVDYIDKNFEDIGTNFYAEALKIHYGVAEKRNIKGSATFDEEKILEEEGVEFFKLPLPKKDDDEDKKN
jgi:hypothetical protein